MLCWKTQSSPVSCMMQPHDVKWWKVTCLVSSMIKTTYMRQWNDMRHAATSADPEGGGPGVRTPPPPWYLSEVGSCVEAWWVGEGSNGCFYLIIINLFWLALLASILYKHISICIHTSKSNVQHGTVTLSLYFPYPNHEKIPTSHPLVAFIRGHFHIYLVSKYTIFWGRIPKPPPRHINNITTTMSSVCLWRERLAIVQKAMPYWK